MACFILLTIKASLLCFLYIMAVFSPHCFFLGNLTNFNHHPHIHDFLIHPQPTHIPSNLRSLYPNVLWAHVQWTGSPTGLWVSPVAQPGSGVRWSQLCVLTVPKGRVPTHTCVIIQVSDLCFWTFQTPPTGVPILPHYLSLDIALNITVMANSDSILDCQRDQAICCALGLQKLSI